MNFFYTLCFFVLLMGCASCEHQSAKSASRGKCVSEIVERSTAGFGTCDWRMRIRVEHTMFSSAEADEIGQALLNWSKASGGRICFDIEWVSMCQEYEKKGWLIDGVTTLYGGNMPWHRSASTQGSCNLR
jgi:hypothetical protein